ncbi:MAG: DUF262 domain-containing protein [Mesorhizobium amorphae]|nr:MAG: DUF262 domain-containing protein [Mesorhizobium amorphae]
MIITNNNYSILEIIGMLERKELVVNRDYQRSSGLWTDSPSSYFIDTILEGYPFPKIYMYESVDRPNRSVRKEIVDGQQRIKAITRYHDNEFSLKVESRYSNKKFEELDPEVQDMFLSYPVSVDVIRNASRTEILQMFRRMNAYTLPLNEPEKRHSTFQGAFKWFVNRTTDSLNEFFVLFEVFTDRQVLRMADADFVSECVLALEKGVVSTSAADLRSLYRRYDTSFPKMDQYGSHIDETVSFIVEHFSILRGSHMMKPYALHSLFTALLHNKFGIDAIDATWGVEPSGSFAKRPSAAAQELLALARAHEAGEDDGPYGLYVWGCAGGTNRLPRRTARVASILRALGVSVPDAVDDHLT